MKIWLRVVSVLIGVNLLVLSYTYLENIYEIEWILVEAFHISWVLIPFFIRLFVGVMIGFGIFFLSNLLVGRKALKGALLFHVIILLFLIYPKIAGVINSHQAYQGLNSNGFTLSLFIQLFFSTLLVVFFFGKNRLAWTQSKWLKRSMVLLAFVPAFIFNPFFMDELIFNEGIPENSEVAEEVAIVTNENFIESNKEGKHLVAFFTSGCPHCKMAAKRLKASSRIDGFPEVDVFFVGDKSGVEYFFTTTNTWFENSILPVDQFFKLSGGRFPTFFFYDNGKVTHHWTGRTFTYGTINNLSKL